MPKHISEASNSTPAQSKKLKKDEDVDDFPKLSRSCDHCKLKKVKCDGFKPICSFCSRNGLESCNYSYMKKPGLKPGYGKSMLQRLESLENDVESLRTELQTIKSNENAVGAASFTSSSDLSPVSWKSIQIPTLLNPPDHEASASSKLPSRAQCVLLIEMFFMRITPIFPLLHPHMAKDLENSLADPPLLVYAVILITLKFLNSDQMPQQDKKVYYERCKEKIISTALKKINLESLQSLIILAFDSLGGSVKVPESWNYVSIASDYAYYLKLGIENSNRPNIVSTDSPNSITSNETIAKKKSKFISNKSLNLLRKPKTWVDEESRRHCFWCIYILDKLFAISSSHELKLKNSTCLLPLGLKLWISPGHNTYNQQKTLKSLDVLSPTPETLKYSISPGSTSTAGTHQENLYDSFTYYIELHKLMGDIHTFLIEEFNIYDSFEVSNWSMKFSDLKNQLFSWVTHLPPSYKIFLKTGTAPESNLEIYDILFFVYYYTTLIKLHSASGFPHGESEFFKASEDSRKCCIDSAIKVYQFVVKLNSIDETIFQKLGPHFGFFIWVNSRILFVSAIYGNKNKDFQKYQEMLVLFSDILYKIGQYWESSMVYHKILQFLNVSDLNYVLRLIAPLESETSEENSDDEIADENREPTKVFSDMRINSHSLLFWFNKLASKDQDQNKLPQRNNRTDSLFNHQQNFANFQTTGAQPFDEFQLTHDDFFNFLALDINGSGSFQDTR